MGCIPSYNPLVWFCRSILDALWNNQLVHSQHEEHDVPNDHIGSRPCFWPNTCLPHGFMMLPASLLSSIQSFQATSIKPSSTSRFTRKHHRHATIQRTSGPSNSISVTCNRLSNRQEQARGQPPYRCYGRSTHQKWCLMIDKRDLTSN